MTVVLLTNTLVRAAGMIAVRSLGARKSRDETKMKLEGAPNSMDTPTENPGGTGAQPMYSGLVLKTTQLGAQTSPGIQTQP
jgi:hypothetical protein